MGIFKLYYLLKIVKKKIISNSLNTFNIKGRISILSFDKMATRLFPLKNN